MRPDLLSPLVPFPEQEAALAAIATNLEDFHSHLLAGTLYAQWKRANPKEQARLETYWATSSPYPSMATQTGIAFRAAYQAHHQAKGD